MEPWSDHAWSPWSQETFQIRQTINSSGYLILGGFPPALWGQNINLNCHLPTHTILRYTPSWRYMTGLFKNLICTIVFQNKIRSSHSSALAMLQCLHNIKCSLQFIILTAWITLTPHHVLQKYIQLLLLVIGSCMNWHAYPNASLATEISGGIYNVILCQHPLSKWVHICFRTNI